MHILHVVGARANLMKAAPVLRALAKRPAARQTLVHTGQHYDKNLSDVFFSQLSMREPDVNLEGGSRSHAWQTAEVMTRFEPVVLDRKPDVVLARTHGPSSKLLSFRSGVAAAVSSSSMTKPHVAEGHQS